MSLAYRAAAAAAASLLAMLLTGTAAAQEKTQKPPLHGSHWMAITGKPLAATAGARMFEKGGNAVDAACAMLAATATMWDVLSWGGETQALIYHPGTRRIVAINGLGVAPSGATVDFYHGKDMKYPPEDGPLAAVTPGTPGALITMLAQFGKLSLGEVLAPAIELADGYPIDAETADRIETEKDTLRQWPYSKAVMLPHAGESREAPRAGEMFRQPDLAATLRRLVEAEAEARKAGEPRREAIMAAYERFYRGDIADEFVRGAQEQGALITKNDLDRWRVKLEEPVRTNYRGIDVYKLDRWVQGPVMLQALNILENFDLKAMGYNSASYIHTVYQAMNLAFADRDFYYGDPYYPPEEPIKGLLSKEYAKERAALIKPDRNDPSIGPGDPYPHQGGSNPYLETLKKRAAAVPPFDAERFAVATDPDTGSFLRGTTTVVAADREGWLVSMTPSGGWVPAVIAGRSGVGMSQRAQSYVLDSTENPFNVIEPGKRPRATLTPSLAFKDGRPWLAFAVQGGDTQDQNLLQFFLNIVEFGMTPQQAAEAPNFNSWQMHDSFGQHEIFPGRVLLNNAVPDWVRRDLRARGYKPEYASRTSGPINAILLDHARGTMWGGSSNHGEDYGIAW
ncbi:MAG: gamma-glutamyltransferase family protein [Steroidobacteraceae bacterium]